MKRRNTTYTIALTALVAAVTVYITLYIVGMLKNPFQSVPAVRYTYEESLSATGYVVRNEEVLTTQYDLVEPVHAAGERVAAGEVIARIYSDEKAYRLVREIDELESRLEQIRRTFDSSASGGDASSLETQINAALMSLSGTARKDNIHEYEDRAENLKSLLLRKEYLYGRADSLEQTVRRLESEIASLKRAGGSGFTDILSERAGTFSPFVDGYERILNTSVLEGMTLEDFDELETVEAAAPAGAYGKIISGTKWCFVAAVDSDDIEGLRVGNKVSVLFAGNFGRKIEMRILYLTEGMDGRTLITLQAKGSLHSVTALRRQTVEMSFGAYEGIRIPKRALAISSDGTRGVYCVDGMTASFKKVTIINQTGDYYIVREDKDDPFALRVGNEVIVTLKGIYEGKILE